MKINGIIFSAGFIPKSSNGRGPPWSTTESLWSSSAAPLERLWSAYGAHHQICAVLHQNFVINSLSSTDLCRFTSEFPLFS